MKLQFLLFVVVMLYLSMVRASCDAPAEPSFLTAAIHLKTSTAIQRLKADSCKLEFLRKVCTEQMRGTQIPTACLEVLEAEKIKGLISIKTFDENRLGLLHLCAVRASHSDDRGDLLEAARHELSSCAALIQERIGDLEYAANENRPEVGFSNRLEQREPGHRIVAPKVGPEIE